LFEGGQWMIDGFGSSFASFNCLEITCSRFALVSAVLYRELINRDIATLCSTSYLFIFAYQFWPYFLNLQCLTDSSELIIQD
jgi:hypothetical protein